MQEIVIRQATADDCAPIAVLIEKVFAEYNAPEISLRGQVQFLALINPKNIRARIFSGACILVAFVNGELAGVIEMRIYSHIALLFTARKYQRHGVARALLQVAIGKCRKQRPALREITVNSSTYAVQIYERLGFERRGEKRDKDGVRTTPMILLLRAPVE